VYNKKVYIHICIHGLCVLNEVVDVITFVVH